LTSAEDMLETTEVSINRALHRARHAIDRVVQHRAQAPLPGSREKQRLVARFAAAFEGGDIDGVVALLTDDGVLRMPPEGMSTAVARPSRASSQPCPATGSCNASG
jgi:hypothetical protein